MALATGAGSKIIYAQYTSASMATAPTTNFKNLPFSTESLTENINEIRSQDITASRAATGIRGGNIAAGGAFTGDLGIKRHAELWKHLLGHDTGSTAYTGTYTGVAASTTAQTTPTIVKMYPYSATAWVRGQYVIDTANIVTGSSAYTGSIARLFVCTRGGTSTASAGGLTSITTEIDAGGGCKFKYVAPARLLPLRATTYIAGDIVYSATITAPFYARYYICRKGGTVTAAEVTAKLTGTTRNVLSATVWDYVQEVETQKLANYTAEDVTSFATGDLFSGAGGLYVLTLIDGTGTLTVAPEDLDADTEEIVDGDAGSNHYHFQRVFAGNTNFLTSSTIEVGAVVGTLPIRGAGTIAGFYTATSGKTVRGGTYVCSAKGSSETIAASSLTGATATSAGAHGFVRINKAILALRASSEYEVGDMVVGKGPSSVHGIYQVVVAGSGTDASTNWDDLTSTDDAETESTGMTFKYFGTAEGLIIWEHVMYPGQVLPAKGLMVEKRITGGDQSLYVTFEKARINTVEITIPQEGIVTSSWTFSAYSSNNGRDGSASITSATINEVADETIAGYECFVVFGAATNPQAVRPIRNASFSLSNQIDESNFVVGDRYRQGLPESQRNVSGRFTTYFQDRTEYTVFKGETTTTLDFHMITLGGEQMVISLGECKLTGTGVPNTSGSGTMSADFTFGAMKQYANTDVSVTLRSFLPALFYYTV